MEEFDPCMRISTSRRRWWHCFGLLLVVCGVLGSGCADMFNVSQNPTSDDRRPQWNMLGVWPKDIQN